MMIYCAISRQRLGQWGPWIAVMIMACAAEGLDFWDDINAYGSWRWKRSVHDIINTMVWPSLLLLIGRFMPSLLAGSKR
ncbi:MAG: hypothetical protein MI864_14810 [Pseudomonadales bacterium]|nr:hypothetical protein [Oleiphilus messinensis]MCG8611796.1 hypothetical protein [Pseudomonadales bacterium]